MDGQCFDDLARLIGSGATRRRVLQALAGGVGSFLLGNNPARAQCTNPDTCQADSECCLGYACDAPSSTCTEVLPDPCGSDGVSCASDADCCIGSCIGGICQCQAAGGPCTVASECCLLDGQTMCINGACGTCHTDGAVCTATADCCQGECFQGVCATCRGDSSPCADPSECCNGDCFNGICVSCRQTGNPCDAGHVCCGGFCVGGACVTCKDSGSACADASECCSGDCYNGACAACRPPGAQCTDGTTCCGAAGCVHGVCTGCGPLEVPCPDYANCCIGECVGGVTCTPCRDERDTCLEDAHCCSGTCFHGRCARCEGTGASCTTSADCCSGICLQTDAGLHCAGECRGANVACVDNSSCCSDSCLNGRCTAPTCSTDADCGFDQDCNRGICRVQGVETPTTGECQRDSDCAPGQLCDVDRSGVGVCRQPCRAFGQSCGEAGSECCSDLTCENGYCVDTTCLSEGKHCAADADCCGALVCIDGACDLERGPDDHLPGKPGPIMVTTLPNTGVDGGDAAGDNTDSLLGITLAAGAASFLLRKKARSASDASTGEE